jgi:hypothetical protein
LHWIIIKQLTTFHPAIRAIARGLNTSPPRDVANGRAKIPFPMESFAMLMTAPKVELPDPEPSSIQSSLSSTETLATNHQPVMRMITLFLLLVQPALTQVIDLRTHQKVDSTWFEVGISSVSSEWTTLHTQHQNFSHPVLFLRS